jgi:predicted nucleic acid-binding protein
LNSVFVDTSALYAVLVRGDGAHERAARTFRALRAAEPRLVTSSAVLLETYALLGHRIGIDAVSGLRDALEPLLDVIWVDRRLHERALDRLIADAGRKGLVDVISFVVMEELGIEAAFSFDSDFEAAGFRRVPDPGS